MTASNHVLRFPRSDEEGSFILAEVTPTGSGSRPLNLKIVASEGVAPYVVSLRHGRVDKLKVKNCPCSQEEWEHILASILLDGEPVEDIEAAAAVQEEESITITFRKRISGITQRLGSLSLTHKEDEAIELYDWCGAAIASRAQIKIDLAKANARASELEAAANELRGQLEELIRAKGEDEAALLEKFRDLLNEKKVKIREQQRLLAAAPVSATAQHRRSKTPEVKEEKASQATPPAKAAGKKTSGRANRATKPATRAPKRKAKAAEPSDDESSDGFEQMDVDQGQQEKDEQVDEDAETTEAEATASEADDDDEDEDAEPVPAVKASSSRASRAKADDVSKKGSQISQDDEVLPPRRTLPFNNGKPPAKKPGPPPKAAAAAGDESETDSDDEL